MSQNPEMTFTDRLLPTLQGETFLKLALGHYTGAEAGLQKLLVRPILVKKQRKLSFTYRYKTRDIVKNYDAVEAASLLQGYLRDFKTATLQTTAFDLAWDGKKKTLKESPPSQTMAEPLEHNRTKKRLITAEGKPYLHALGITGAHGRVHPTAQDKYRQINKYIEVLQGPLAMLAKQPLRVADMGAGKGYLTFALYDYLQSLGTTAQVTGVEYREDLVALCNGIAKESGFDGLQFVQGTIDGFDSRGINLLIALHACDTATDDAIAKGIRAGADAIVVAPCCHKQIRREMETATPAPSLEFLLRHGTLMERQAEMVTDGLRVLLLELHGYRTKLFEFISDAHTPKNVMIIAERTQGAGAKRETLRQQIAQAKTQFGIQQHYLETLLADEPA